MADLRPHIADEYRVRGWAAAPVTASYGATLYGSIFSRSSGRARYGRFRPKTQKITPRGAHRWPVAHGRACNVYLETRSGVCNSFDTRKLLRATPRTVLDLLIVAVGQGRYALRHWGTADLLPLGFSLLPGAWT